MKYKVNKNTVIPEIIGFNSSGVTYNLPEVTVTPKNNTAPLSTKDLKDKELLLRNINQGQNAFAKNTLKAIEYLGSAVATGYGLTSIPALYTAAVKAPIDTGIQLGLTLGASE